MVNTNQDAITGSVYESAQECLEDNLQALSTETLTALHMLISGDMAGLTWLNATVYEIIEARRNAAA